MNLFAVSFFGHRQVDDPFLIERQLESIIRELLLTKEYVEFLVGRDGEFDQLVSSTVRRCKRTIRDDNSSLVLVATLTYGDQNDKDNNIYYRILKTTFYEGDPEEITGLHTEALGVLFPVDSMDSCEEMMIQDWPGALYKKDDTAFLCWTYSPEVTYVLEYTPSKLDDSEIIKMAESAEPVK